MFSCGAFVVAALPSREHRGLTPSLQSRESGCILKGYYLSYDLFQIG